MQKLFYVTGLFVTIIIKTINVYGQAGTVPVNPPGGGFAIDGYLQRQGIAGDWLAGPGGSQSGTFILSNLGIPLVPSPVFFHVIDLWDNTNDDVFANNSKFDDNPNDMRWTLRRANTKNDINHAIVFFTQDPLSGHIWAILSGDRFNTTGTDIIDFEVLQSPVVKTALGNNGTGGFISSGPHGGRTVGDLVISVQLSRGGGSFSSVSVRRWVPVSETAYGYTDVLVDPGTIFAASNAVPVQVPYGAFGSTTYPALSFAEAAVDFGGFGGGCSQGTPFRTIWIKSRSSTSNSAQLQDFAELIQVPFNLAGYELNAEAIFYDLFTADVIASITPGTVDDYDFFWTPSPANPPGGSLSNPFIYNPVFTTANSDGCISYSYEVQAKLKSTGCLVARKSIAFNAPCKIGKPINPDKTELRRNEAREGTANTEIQVYPNPNKGTATIVLPDDTGLKDVELLDMKGAVVQRWKNINGKTIQLKNLSSGFYLIKMTTIATAKTVTKKIIVNK